MPEYYKNAVLAVAAISNKIFLTSTTKNGKMSMNRRDMTDETINAIADYTYAVGGEFERIFASGYKLTVKIEKVEI